MQCPGCQRDNPPLAKFCLECGARLGLHCKHCGTDLPIGAKFCLECGHGVSRPLPTSRRAPAKGGDRESYHSLTDDLFASSRVGIFILNHEFKVVWVNAALERYFGIQKHQLIGKDKRELIRSRIANNFENPKEFADRVLATYRDNSYIENFECHVLPSDSRQERWLEHWSQPIRTGLYAGGRIEHYTDVTQRKQAEEALRRSERLASIGTLAAGVAHEINNPIGSIVFAADYALENRHAPEADRIMEKALTDIIDNANRCGLIVKSVLQFSRQEPLEVWIHDLNDVVRHALDLTRREFARQGIRLDANLTNDALLIPLNPTQIEQVIVNLLRNAVASGKKGSRVEVTTERTSASIRLRITDDGPGMSVETKQRLFDPFFTTRAEEGGTGLGLSVSHGIVMQHGGRIEVESAVGSGTTILIDLPFGEGRKQ